MNALTTMDYANAYIAKKINAEEWNNASESLKEALLFEATTTIYSIQGFKFTPEVIELLTAVPDDLQQACCEVALALSKIDTENPHIINQKLGIKSISFGQDSASYDEKTCGSLMPSYIFSSYAQSILNKYILKGFKYV